MSTSSPFTSDFAIHITDPADCPSVEARLKELGVSWYLRTRSWSADKPYLKVYGDSEDDRVESNYILGVPYCPEMTPAQFHLQYGWPAPKPAKVAPIPSSPPPPSTPTTMCRTDSTDTQAIDPQALRSAYLTLQAASGIEVGDTVRVIRRAKGYEMGWKQSGWSTQMDTMVGSPFTVQRVTENGVHISGWVFPFYVLQLVSKGPGKQPPARIDLFDRTDLRDANTLLVKASGITTDDQVRFVAPRPDWYPFGDHVAGLVGQTAKVRFADKDGFSLERPNGETCYASLYSLERIDPNTVLCTAKTNLTVGQLVTASDVTVGTQAADPANFVVDTDGSETLSRIVQELAIRVGVTYQVGQVPDPTVARPDNLPFILVARRAEHDHQANTIRRSTDGNLLSFQRNWPRYSASTQMGEIVRLLSTPWTPPAPPKPPAPVGPTVHGHPASYAKGQGLISIGCAQVSVALLKRLSDTICDEYWSGNRRVTSFTSDRGETLTAAQIKDLLAYVAAVDSYQP